MRNDSALPLSKRMSHLSDLIKTGLPSDPGIGLLVGPSHAVRWQHAITTGALPAPFQDTRVIGRGGFPVWNRSLFGQIIHSHETGRPIFLIVPDFRFGNSLYEVPHFVSGSFYNDHSHVKRELIRPEVDTVMYRHHVNCLETWRSLFGPDLTIFDWTQLMTASEHRWAGRYIDEAGVYQNRAYIEWVRSDRHKLGGRSWPEALLADDNARLRNLYVDRSLHPSAIGFFLLHYMTQGAPFVDALHKSEALWSRWMHGLVHLLEPILVKLGPVAVMGDSVWFNTVLRLLGAEGLWVLENRGLLLMDSKEPSKIMPEGALYARITDHVHLKGAEDGTRENPFRFQWGVFARKVVADRHPHNAHLAVPELDKLIAPRSETETAPLWLERVLRLGSPETFVDAGAELAPTFVGMGMTLLTLCECLLATKGLE